MAAPALWILRPGDAVLALGDSLTANGLLSNEQNALVPLHFGPSLALGGGGGGTKSPLGAAPSYVYTPSAAPLTWTIDGVSGRNTADLLAALPASVYARSFTKLVVQGGVNDTLQFMGGDPTKDFAFTTANVTAICDGLRAHYPTMPIAWILPLFVGERQAGAYPWNPFDTDCDSRCNIIKGILASHDITAIDLRGASDDPPVVGPVAGLIHQYELAHNPGNLAGGILTSDNVHPTDAGEAVIAEWIDSFISCVR